jgi:peptidoglycan/xylan/chitin deacetylase (PgdA/CDA1 family)
MIDKSSSAVLMYHAVGQPVKCKRDTFLNVSTDSFRRQMRALASLGYRAITFGEIVDVRRSGLSFPRRIFAATFDDAFRSVGEIAAPIMREYGFSGTLFVVSNWTSSSKNLDLESGHIDAPLLSWDALRDLINLGWEIGGHTATHPHLDVLDDICALNEILCGKQEIEQRLGLVARTFCYPFGHTNQRTPELVREAGFIGACTVRSGLVTQRSNPYTLPRVKVGYRDGVTGLLYRLLVRPSMPTFRRNRRSHTAH